MQFGPKSEQVALALDRLGACHTVLGQTCEAYAYLSRAVAIVETLAPPNKDLGW